MKKLFLLLFIGCLLAACDFSKNEISEKEKEEIVEPSRELKLSVSGRIDIGEAIDYEFDILDGNGDYIVISEIGDAAKVTLDGTKVKVNLFENTVWIKVIDKEQQSERIEIYSSSELLRQIGYSVHLDMSDPNITMKGINFGVGGYSIQKIKGNSAEVKIDKNDFFIIKALKPGNSYFDIVDRRGKKAGLTIIVSATYDLVTGMLDVEAVNDQMLTVILKYGDGGWQFAEKPSSGIFERVTIMPLADQYKKYDVLQVDTTSKEIKGTGVIKLIDKNGHTATIKVTVR